MADEKMVLEDGRVIKEDIRYTGVRKAIGNTFVECVNSKPMTDSFVRYDMGSIMDFRKKMKEQGKKVSVSAIFIKLCAGVLKDNPMMNAELDGNRIHLFESVNIAVAIASPNDLLYTPVVRDADKKSVFEINDELNALIAKVNDNTLGFEDMSGGTFTISNLGATDVCFTSQLFGPGSCIIGIGTTHKEFVPDENGNPVCRPIGYLNLTVDHRVILGSHATRFYRALIEAAENCEANMGI